MPPKKISYAAMLRKNKGGNTEQTEPTPQPENTPEKQAVETEKVKQESETKQPPGEDNKPNGQPPKEKPKPKPVSPETSGSAAPAAGRRPHGARGHGGRSNGRGHRHYRGRHRAQYQGYRQPYIYHGRYVPQYMIAYDQYGYQHQVQQNNIVHGMAGLRIQQGYRQPPHMGQMRAPVPYHQGQYYAPVPVYSQQPQQQQQQQPSSSVNPQIQMFSQMCQPQAGGDPIFSVDVECVATGPQHDKRTVAQIALVDQFEQVKLNMYVKPKEKVFSYLTGLTGLTEELIEKKGIPLDEAISKLKKNLPKNGVLVGQNILKDVHWLGLEEGKDFKGMRDLAGLWRAYNKTYGGYTYFSLAHEAKSLLAVVQKEPHNAATDAIISVRLYNLYQNIHKNPKFIAEAERLLLATPMEKSFAAKNPVYDRVCMGRRKECKCGAPFLYI